MPVYKLNSGKWAFKINKGAKQIYRSGFKSKLEAELAEVQMKLQLENNNVKQKDIKIITAKSLETFFENLLYQEYKITTAYAYFKFFKKHVQKFFSPKNIKEITNLDLINYVNYVDKMKKANKSMFVSIAKLYLNFLKRYGAPGLDLSLLRFKRKTVETEKKVNFYIIDEFNKFLNVINDNLHKLMFSLFYYYGLRLGELKGLQHKDFDFKNNLLLIRRAVSNKTGTGKQEFVDLKSASSKRNYPLLNQIKSLYKVSFINKVDNNALVFSYSETSINRYNKRYARESGLKKIKLHEFRHSCASFLINNGMDYMQVASWLGHKSPTTTLNIYSHLFPNRKQEIADFIDKLNESY